MGRLNAEKLKEILTSSLPDGEPASAAILRAGDLVIAQVGTREQPARFPIYSLAKTVIATLALSLVDDGLLSFDDPIAKWHPEVPGADRVTLIQLLGHRGGFRDYGNVTAYHTALAEHPRNPWTREEFGRHTWLEGLLFEPGSRFAYSNPGFRLLQEIVTQVGGGSFQDLSRQRISEPLGLTHTSVLETYEDYQALERGSSLRLGGHGERRDVAEWMHPDWVFHGTLGSSAEDMVRFLVALAEGRLLSATTTAAMCELQSIGRGAPPWEEPSYGLGVMGDPRSSHGFLWGHNGGGPGFTASAFHAPQHKNGSVTVCVLCASETSEAAEGVLRKILEAA